MGATRAAFLECADCGLRDCERRPRHSCPDDVGEFRNRDMGKRNASRIGRRGRKVGARCRWEWESLPMALNPVGIFREGELQLVIFPYWGSCVFRRGEKCEQKSGTSLRSRNRMRIANEMKSQMRPQRLESRGLESSVSLLPKMQIALVVCSRDVKIPSRDFPIENSP